MMSSGFGDCDAMVDDVSGPTIGNALICSTLAKHQTVEDLQAAKKTLDNRSKRESKHRSGCFLNAL